jgi:iron transport multicopper oxidase
MAISLSYFPILALLLLICSRISEAATVTYDFNITWVTTNPDGLFDRTTIGINGEWPIPIIRATVGDRVIVNVDNQLGNESTTLHFHGLYMNGTNHMDGPLGVTQCAISDGTKFTYNFTVLLPKSCLSKLNANLLTSRSTNRVHTGTVRL